MMWKVVVEPRSPGEHLIIVAYQALTAAPPLPPPPPLDALSNMQERQTGGFNPEMDEELEDASGNVYSRRVYEDLRRQGLL